MIGKIPEHIKRRGRKKKEKRNERIHCKKKWRIINPHYAFMTVRSVYERNLPFLLLEVDKGLCPVANSYTLVLVSLFIDSVSDG
jgi:hypothetical protein